ncbi:MAG: FxsA family protein [Acidiferrobacterales bacterium]
MPIFALFLIIPLAEIWFLIKVGGIVGAGWTVFLVVFTAVVGAALVRVQGLSTLNRIQQSMQQGKMPAVEMFEGLALFLAGALLLTPGFFTDAIGFSLLIPPLRRLIIKSILMRSVVKMSGGSDIKPGGGSAADPKPLDGQWRRED